MDTNLITQMMIEERDKLNRAIEALTGGSPTGDARTQRKGRPKLPRDEFGGVIHPNKQTAPAPQPVTPQPPPPPPPVAPVTPPTPPPPTRKNGKWTPERKASQIEAMRLGKQRKIEEALKKERAEKRAAKKAAAPAPPPKAPAPVPAIN
jgi:hypothetical protein